MRVAFAVDDRYLEHSAAMLWSIAASQPEARVDARLLCSPNVPQARIDAVTAMLEGTPISLTTHRIAAEAVDGLPSWGRIPTTMWYRVLLPELLPEADRVLYLDVDVVVLDALTPLWDVDLKNNYVGAVTNVPERHRLRHAAELGLRGPADYFNSGVLLMNLAAMRADDITSRLIACARRRRGELLWPDQDVLNLVLGPRRLALDPRWNLMNSIVAFPWAGELMDAGAIERAIADPGIVHFEGPAANKPWHLLCASPYRHAYRQARRQTPWPRYWPEGVTLPNLGLFAWRRLRDTLGAATP